MDLMVNKLISEPYMALNKIKEPFKVKSQYELKNYTQGNLDPV